MRSLYLSVPRKKGFTNHEEEPSSSGSRRSMEVILLDDAQEETSGRRVKRVERDQGDDRGGSSCGTNHKRTIAKEVIG